MPDVSFYNKLYLLQDDALRALSGKTDFYLTGGTAISRFHYGHRYSDDLDFFVSHSHDFRKASRVVISALTGTFPVARVELDTDTFVRIFISHDNDIMLKVELIHDVEFHYGGFGSNDVYHRIDNPRNILSNKLCALSRSAPKDVADIIAICEHEQFLWPDLFEEADRKDTWANVLTSINVLSNMSIDSLTTVVQWTDSPDPQLLESRIETICRDMAKAGHNSVFSISQ